MASTRRSHWSLREHGMSVIIRSRHIRSQKFGGVVNIWGFAPRPLEPSLFFEPPYITGDVSLQFWRDWTIGCEIHGWSVTQSRPSPWLSTYRSHSAVLSRDLWLTDRRTDGQAERRIDVWWPPLCIRLPTAASYWYKHIF